jgi:hypothetical protein
MNPSSCGLTSSVPVCGANGVDKNQENTFDEISRGIGSDAFDARWHNYTIDVGHALAGGNPYDDMRAVMASLGLSTQGSKGYEGQFGLTVKPSLQAIQGDTNYALMTASPATPEITDSAGTTPAILTAPLLVQPTTTSAENNAMRMSGLKWLSGMTLGVAVSATSVATAQAATDYAMGECQVATAGENESGVQVLPTVDADSYIMRYQNQSSSPLKKYASSKYSFREAAIKVLIAPKHGEFILDSTSNPAISTAKEGWYVYVADKGFTGEDTFVVQVEKYGLSIQIHYTIEVPMPDEATYGLCDPEHWKISQIDVEDINGTALASTTFTSETPFQPASPSAYLTNVASNPPSTHIGFSDLAGSAVGQESTSGVVTTITLDSNAAGYNRNRDGGS